MAEQIALMVAGVVAPFIVNLFKGNMTGKPAFALAAMTSFSLALAVKLVLPTFLGGLPGEGIDPIAAMGEVFAIATIVYKVFLEKKGE